MGSSQDHRSRAGISAEAIAAAETCVTGEILTQLMAPTASSLHSRVIKGKRSGYPLKHAHHRSAQQFIAAWSSPLK